MNKKDVEAIVEKIPFERYGWVNLPYGLHTKGLDRSSTLDIIFPEKLTGKTHLDVGSAYGYFCFEAERLGADRVVGFEIKPERLARANLFKNIIGSKVEFINDNVTTYPLDKFDYVTILNVAHHMKTEALSLIERLISLTKERFIIESPPLPRLKMSLEQVVQLFDFAKVEIVPSPLTGPEAGERQIAICHVTTQT